MECTARGRGTLRGWERLEAAQRTHGRSGAQRDGQASGRGAGESRHTTQRMRADDVLTPRAQDPLSGEKGQEKVYVPKGAGELPLG